MLRENADIAVDHCSIHRYSLGSKTLPDALKAKVLPYHTEVRWLSRGKVVNHVLQLFLQQKRSDLTHHFSDPEWLFQLSNLGDIFNELNKGNVALQGWNVTIIDTKQAVSAFVGKLKLWSRRVAKGVVVQFPTLDTFVDEHEDG